MVKKETYRLSGKCGPQTSLINFAEGVFSIAATIDVARLVSLDLVVGGDTSNLSVPKITENLPTILSTFFSFLFVCRARGRHVIVFDCIDTVNDTVTFLSSLYLLVCSFIPVAISTITAWSTTHSEPSLKFAFTSFLGLQVTFVLLDIISMVTLWYIRRAKLFVPKWITGRNSANWSQTVSDEDVRITDYSPESIALRENHYKALMTQFMLTMIVTVALTPLAFVPWRLISLLAMYFLPTLGLKHIMGCIPFFRRRFAGELKQPLNKSRLIGFHDNVFSILATILVIIIDLPETKEDSPLSFFDRNQALMIGFAVGFIMTSAVWSVHKDILDNVVRLTSVWRQVNQVVLATTCYLPTVALIAAEAFVQSQTASCVCDEDGSTTTTTTTTTPAVTDDNITLAEATLKPVVTMLTTGLVISFMYLLYWTVLVIFRRDFLSKEPKHSAYYPMMFAKMSALPLCCITGILFAVVITGTSLHRRYILLWVFTLPVFWRLMKFIGGKFISKKKVYGELEVEDDTHPLKENLLNDSADVEL